MMWIMRTTFTLDPNVERLLRNAVRRSGESFQDVLNRAVIRGLADEEIVPEEEPFVVSSWPMGLQSGFDPGRFNSLYAELEADAFISLTRDLLNRSRDG